MFWRTQVLFEFVGFSLSPRILWIIDAQYVLISLTTPVASIPRVTLLLNLIFRYRLCLGGCERGGNGLPRSQAGLVIFFFKKIIFIVAGELWENTLIKISKSLFM